MEKFKFKTEKCAYIVIDMQERLAGAMPQERLKMASKNTASMVQVCNAMKIPIIPARQYPKGLGEILPEINQHLKQSPIDKLIFSVYKEPTFKELFKQYNVKHFFISGMETHVCVLQTVIDLMSVGCAVHILEDCCTSRTMDNHKSGIEFMRQAGAIISNSETAMFQLIGSSQHENFKLVSSLVK